jgi:CubicO group peptidase (beta-lactamase class C family)
MSKTSREFSEAQIERLAEPYIENKLVAGLAIGAILDSNAYVVNLGMLGRSRGTPTADSVFELGSISKVLAANG